MNIERGIPYPGDASVHIGTRRTLGRHDSAGNKYPFRDMCVGDCFVVIGEDARVRATMAANRYRGTADGGHGAKRFSSRKMPIGHDHDDGIGIWRVR